MARLLKPLVVETYRSEAYGVEVPIYYNRNFHFHEVEVQGKTYHNPDIHKVREWIAETVAEVQAVVWMPVIEVALGDPSPAMSRGMKVGVGLGVHRFHVATPPDGKHRWADWDSDPDRRLGHEAKDFQWPHGKPFQPPCAYPQGYAFRNGPYYYPYEDALWGRLEQIVVQLTSLKAQLTSLVDTRNGAYRRLLTPDRGLFLPGKATEVDCE
jgi:hypothetical protein